MLKLLEIGDLFSLLFHKICNFQELNLLYKITPLFYQDRYIFVRIRISFVYFYLFGSFLNIEVRKIYYFRE